MTRRFATPDADCVKELRATSERRLSPEEFNAYVDAPMSDREREEIHALIDWFSRRYPTPVDRWRAARRFYERAKRRMPHLG